MYQQITMKSKHLVCYRHETTSRFTNENGKHLRSEYTILITPNLMQVVDFADGTMKAYESKEPHPEYHMWRRNTLKKQGYSKCSLMDYLIAQATLETWLKKGKEPVAPAKARGTHFNNLQLT